MNNIIMNDFSRQVNIFKPEEFNIPVHIIGAGATGSWIAFSLAKMGIQNITVYDFDEVGMHNLPNQMFRLNDIEGNKATQIKKIIRQFTGYNIKAKEVKVDGSIPLQGIVFVLTDTMYSRQDIYNRAIKYNPNIQLLIETRMDLRGGRIYAIEPKNRLHTEAYEQTFYSDDEAETSACGVSQTVLPSALAITSHAIWKMLNFINDEPFDNETIFDFSNEIVFTTNFSDKKEVKVKTNILPTNLRDKIFHCDTEEKANNFLKLCEEKGIVWKGGDKPTLNNLWEAYKEDTCYYVNEENRLSYADKSFYKTAREYRSKEFYEL